MLDISILFPLKNQQQKTRLLPFGNAHSGETYMKYM